MITYNWNKEKNLLLKETRGISFEQIVMHIEKGDLIDIIKHPNEEKYPGQKIYIILLQNYVHMIPFVKDGDEIFLKTIVPSRKMNKLYKGKHHENG